MLPIQRQEFRIKKWPLYFVVAIYIGLLFILNDTGKLQDDKSIIILGGLSVFIFIYFMLSKNKLVIDNDEITQQLFFGKQKVLKWKEMKSSHLNWHFSGHSADISWSFIDYSGKAINIQASFYSRKKIKFIAEALIDKCPQAVIDKRLKNIANGKFPWYIL